MMRYVYRVSLCSFLLAGTSCLVFGRQAVTSQNPKSTSIMLPPGTIDGSKTPQLIPDATAYRLFFTAVSEPITKTAKEAERERVKLLRAQFSPEDLQAAVAIFDGFHQQRQALELRYRKAISTASSSDKAGIERNMLAERDALVADTRDTLASALSTEGLLQLDRLIQREKSNMMMAPFPSMSGMLTGTR